MGGRVRGERRGGQVGEGTGRTGGGKGGGDRQGRLGDRWGTAMFIASRMVPLGRSALYLSKTA